MAALVENAESSASELDLAGLKDFKQQRKKVREHLAASGLVDRIEEAVRAVVPE